MHWRRKWQPTPVFLPGESQGRGRLVGCCLWGCTESDTTEATCLVNNLKDDFDICIFTGYDIEYVKQTGITGVKYWKCGKFDEKNLRESKKTDKEYILASPNQDFYDSNYNKLSENGILTF